MKTVYLVPLIFLSACSTTPRLTLCPQQPAATDNSEVRYPDIVRAYHFGRYVDPRDDLVMHERHVVYRVEENTRWNLHSSQTNSAVFQFTPPRDATFVPAPTNDAILAEVNAQKLATARITIQAKTLESALAQFQAVLQQTRTNFQEVSVLRASVVQMKKQLDTLGAAQQRSPLNSPTNEPSDALEP